MYAVLMGQANISVFRCGHDSGTGRGGLLLGPEDLPPASSSTALGRQILPSQP